MLDPPSSSKTCGPFPREGGPKCSIGFAWNSAAHIVRGRNRGDTFCGVAAERDERFAPMNWRSFGSFSEDVGSCRTGGVKGHAVGFNLPGVQDSGCVRSVAARASQQTKALTE